MTQVKDGKRFAGLYDGAASNSLLEQSALPGGFSAGFTPPPWAGKGRCAGKRARAASLLSSTMASKEKSKQDIAELNEDEWSDGILPLTPNDTRRGKSDR